MANPAPTINQINAFNATQGTIIDFNIIGGTELVRSNRIYIYDLSDNSLICTHLYVSTESIHELPANTDSSIVYESGKSSADFVNGAQYYAQIQTYTDTAGTEGGSGLSVAKMFWCLVDPTLTITTIPSTISTTSYNVSATYNANTSVVSNIIQQYQFNLYSATGSLLQSSGVVVGSGAQQGTSTAYDISYNFTGLSVGSSYYVVVDVTTTQGMNVSTQSNTFTISIDTPTLGEATVVNNACDGYISVTSNLSGEYGGSASGEIASFVTSSVNDVSSLKVTLTPIQDLHGYDKPWVGGAGKNLLDDSKKQMSGNQLAIGYSGVDPWANGVSAHLKAGTYTFSVETADGTDPAAVYVGYSGETGHKFTAYSNKVTFTLTEEKDIYVWAYKSGYKDIGVDAITHAQLELGSTATSYEPYSNICPISGYDEVKAYVTGVNVWDEEWEVGTLSWTTGEKTYASTAIRAKNYIGCEPNKELYLAAPVRSTTYLRFCFYDANKDFISASSWRDGGATITTPQNCKYFMFAAVYGATYNNDISINYPSTDTDYHPYQGNTYTASLPETVYGGTVDLVSGEVVIDRAMVDMGSLTWMKEATDHRFVVNLSTAGIGIVTPPWTQSYLANAVCSNYVVTTRQALLDNDGTLSIHYSGAIYLNIHDEDAWANDTAEQFKTLMSGVQLVYELATPTTIQCDPQTVQTLIGDNNVWGDGSVEITYNIPITNLLVKRQDVADVSGTWLTLHSQPITQASDMDFTFIDFLNQYGKTYKYALVPLLTQTQSGVEVEVEGGYTVSDEVQSIFDGVFIADQTGSQKCKANVGYGDVDMNQAVGTITPIGAKYPVVITNSKNQYHTGSISGTIVPDDYYFNGNLSRIDMVNKRNELEQFLTNKRAKIIKDWNSNIWLVMITENINCTFNNEYGMGLVDFNASWIEVGDPTNQGDLQAAGLIDVGGV